MGQNQSSFDESKRRKEILKIQKKTNLHKVDARILSDVFVKAGGSAKHLTRAQFNDALGQLEKHGLSCIQNTAIAEALFEQFDRDKNGSLDCHEFLSGMLLMCKGSIDEKIALTFQLYDTDKSNFIDKKEMATLIEKSVEGAFALAYSVNAADNDHEMEINEMMAGINSKVVAKTVEAAFQEYDKNGDGRLSLEEFKSWAIKDQTIGATINGMSVKMPITLFSTEKDATGIGVGFSKTQVLAVGHELAALYDSKEWIEKLRKLKKEEDVQPLVDKIAKIAYEKVGIAWKDKKAFEAYSARWTGDVEMATCIRRISDALQPALFTVLQDRISEDILDAQRFSDEAT